jgi:hypothetical protein
MIVKILANAVVSKTGEQKTCQDYYDTSIRSENVILQPKFNLYFGFVCIGIGLVSGIACLYVSVLASLILLAIFVGLGMLLLIQYSNFRIEYELDKIVFTNTFGKRKEFPLNSIIKFYSNDKMVSVVSQNGKIEFAPNCIGTQRFIYFMNKQLKNHGGSFAL